MDTDAVLGAFECKRCAQHSVHPTGGSLRVLGQFAWLEVGSVKAALSRLTHQRVTPAVGRREDGKRNVRSVAHLHEMLAVELTLGPVKF